LKNTVESISSIANSRLVGQPAIASRHCPCSTGTMMAGVARDVHEIPFLTCGRPHVDWLGRVIEPSDQHIEME
ncbi:MAG TPA: hypothetical protein VEQ35_01395, partial [Beijerinckia sp.]|nr:hypothetical protein [Beijerinckia sp.]